MKKWLISGFLTVLVAAPPLGWAGSANRVKAAIDTQTAHQQAISVGAVAAEIGEQAHIFTMAVSAFATENVRSVSWNAYESQTPISYAPIDVYAGSNSSLCGFKAGVGTAVPGFSSPVNLITLQGSPAAPSGWSQPSSYIPPGWSPPFGGDFCSEIWLNKPSAKEYTAISYYVAPSSAMAGSMNMGAPLGSLSYKAVNNINASPIGSSGAFWLPPGRSTMMSTSGAPFTGGN